MYDWCGDYLQQADGEQIAETRMDELGSQFETAQASTNARGLSVGSLFTFDGCPRGDQNREYLVLAATYDMKVADYESLPESSGASYGCNFAAMSSQQQFRPARTTSKPFVQGPQTAVVVGPAGDEIYTDKFGRVKVQFHWDRYGKKDENSSCWIRVSQPWAGKGWGGISIPRIGQEVVVDFLEGDPDRPLIIGRVYNAENMPPFGLPDGGVVSGLKSNTHKGHGYNELSMDDTAGTEKITIHGQYDMNTTVEHDKTTTVNNNRSTTVIVDDTLTVNANRTMHVVGKLAETIDAGQQTTITAGYTETISGGATSTINDGRTSTVNAGSTSTINGGSTSTISGGSTSTVNGACDTTVNGHATEAITGGEEQTVTGEKKVTVNGPHTETVIGPRTMSVTGPIAQTATGTIDIHAAAPGTYTSAALLTLAVSGSVVEITPASITISAGGSTIQVDGSGVTVNGKKISLNC
jgi:type VI secretion system secreted protein VgrG